MPPSWGIGGGTGGGLGGKSPAGGALPVDWGGWPAAGIGKTGVPLATWASAGGGVKSTCEMLSVEDGAVVARALSTALRASFTPLEPDEVGGRGRGASLKGSSEPAYESGNIPAEKAEP